MRTLKVISFLCVLTSHCFILCSCTQPPVGTNCGPISYSVAEILKLLEDFEIETSEIVDVERSSDGSQLFVTVVTKNGPYLLRVSSSATSAIRAPTRKVYVTDNGEIAAWLSSDGTRVTTTNGAFIELPRFSLFDIDHSGTVFIIGEKPNKTWIGRLSSPDRTNLLSDDVLGARIVASGTNLWLTGTTYSSLGGQSVDSKAVAIKLTQRGEEIVTYRRYEFGWAGGVVDVSPCSEELLLVSKSDIWPKIFTFDCDKSRRSLVGSSEFFNLFLSQELITRTKHPKVLKNNSAH